MAPPYCQIFSCWARSRMRIHVKKIAFSVYRDRYPERQRNWLDSAKKGDMSSSKNDAKIPVLGSEKLMVNDKSNMSVCCNPLGTLKKTTFRFFFQDLLLWFFVGQLLGLSMYICMYLYDVSVQPAPSSPLSLSLLLSLRSLFFCIFILLYVTSGSPPWHCRNSRLIYFSLSVANLFYSFLYISLHFKAWCGNENTVILFWMQKNYAEMQ